MISCHEIDKIVVMHIPVFMIQFSFQLKLSQRDLASLVRSNAVPNFRPIEETLSAASQFDDSLIGQKSYAKTMVYSGKKNTLVPKVFSLQEICLNVLMNHIDSK